MRTCFLIGLVVFLMGFASAQAATWQPSPGHVQIDIWPGAIPNAVATQQPESVVAATGHGGWAQINDVSNPTMTVYSPKGVNTGAAVIVFPGGGFRVLAIDLEGTEICDWLTSRGITCVLLKYRVPGGNDYWDEKCRCRIFPKIPLALQDAQRTIKLVRSKVTELNLNPRKIGVIGFSAGGLSGRANQQHRCVCLRAGRRRGQVKQSPRLCYCALSGSPVSLWNTRTRHSRDEGNTAHISIASLGRPCRPYLQ